MGAKHPYRLTNGQRAAVCGLVLAGVPVATGCKIVAAPFVRMLRAIPKSFRNVKPIRVFKGQLLQDLEEAWRNPTLTNRYIARTFVISYGHLGRLAVKNDWPPRRHLKRKHWPKRAEPQRQLAHAYPSHMEAR